MFSCMVFKKTGLLVSSAKTVSTLGKEGDPERCASFLLTVCIQVGTEWTQKNPQKSQFSGVMKAFSGKNL